MRRSFTTKKTHFQKQSPRAQRNEKRRFFSRLQKIMQGTNKGNAESRTPAPPIRKEKKEGQKIERRRRILNEVKKKWLTFVYSRKREEDYWREKVVPAEGKFTPTKKERDSRTIREVFDEEEKRKFFLKTGRTPRKYVSIPATEDAILLIWKVARGIKKATLWNRVAQGISFHRIEKWK